MVSEERSRGRENEIHDDEISLVDLWLVLVRRKWIVLGVAIVCIAGGSWYALQKSIVYEYRSGIELARVLIHEENRSQLKLLTSREGVVAALEDEIIPSTRRSLSGGKPGESPRIEVKERGDSHHLLLTSSAMPDRADQVGTLHETVIKALSSRHADMLEKELAIRLKPYEERVDRLRNQSELLHEQLQLFSGRSHEGNNLQRMVDAQVMADIRRELGEVQVKLADAESALDTIRDASHETGIRFLGIQSESPAGTGRSLILALSGILGLMLGVFGAFFAEFLTVARSEAGKREREGEASA